MSGLVDPLFLRPLWLIGLPLVGALGYWALRRRRGIGGWTGFIDRDLMSALTALGHVVRPSARAHPPAAALVAAALCLALGGPAARDPDAPSFRNLDGVVLVMDMSRSLTLGGGLDGAKAAAVFLSRDLGGRPVGLIVFAGEPYAVGAMTTDAATLESPIAVLGPEVMPDTGSRPDRALEMAAGMLAGAGVIGGDVVLISDGGGIGGGGGGIDGATERAAERVVAAGGRVSTVYVSPGPAIAERRAEGMPSPDPGELARIAAVGGGIAVTAARPDELGRALHRSRGDALARSELAPLVFRDFGRHLLLPALLPALALFRRRAS